MFKTETIDSYGIKVRHKLFLVHAIKPYRGSSGIVPLSFNHGTRYSQYSSSHAGCLTPGQKPDMCFEIILFI
jgi:hypothetical protein